MAKIHIMDQNRNLLCRRHYLSDDSKIMYIQDVTREILTILIPKHLKLHLFCSKCILKMDKDLQKAIGVNGVV